MWPAQVEDSAEGSGSAEELPLASCSVPQRRQALLSLSTIRATGVRCQACTLADLVGTGPHVVSTRCHGHGTRSHQRDLRDGTARTPWASRQICPPVPGGSKSSGTPHSTLPGVSWLQVLTQAQRPLHEHEGLSQRNRKLTLRLSTRRVIAKEYSLALTGRAVLIPRNAAF